jgi:hypothetical protein
LFYIKEPTVANVDSSADPSQQFYSGRSMEEMVAEREEWMRATFFDAPGIPDMAGFAPGTLERGLRDGFACWQHAQIAANTRAHVEKAEAFWSNAHPSSEFLRHVFEGDKASIARHQLLLKRAHPECLVCTEWVRLAKLFVKLAVT